MIIDLFCHIYPQKFLKTYVKTQVPQLLRFVEAEYAAGDAYFVDENTRLKYMNKYGIDLEVLTLALPHIWHTIRDPIKLVTLANDAMAEIAQKTAQGS